ncbi:hypothetical protein AGABI1DRAFT_116319 [Agaricus bisporus var. burnettii JB137-S8]|uniref:Uncharacterized protein n=1 Tax=Agaricus bisporus var. burnettii (strain JB137-S8 / ATCC MYA-4627 / FGSC 10392) TaxID=597362 RepID=K5WXZ9_AGABU|nr:uncharacterized protein AGABI1DRAFT_116319 [Agaricus bisporus var. burnettii JB137-S8]EKM75477.1 hypothetical protein AGABI1DRAFT_116319 [Agaricus bisporus var. burnettii JB137-S8]
MNLPKNIGNGDIIRIGMDVDIPRKARMEYPKVFDCTQRISKLSLVNMLDQSQLVEWVKSEVMGE